jgi:hypothetical protein
MSQKASNDNSLYIDGRRLVNFNPPTNEGETANGERRPAFPEPHENKT